MKIKIPKTYEVQPLKPGQKASDPATCGTCGLSWDDGKVTGVTPAPSGRCPFEWFHVYDNEPTKKREPMKRYVKEYKAALTQAQIIEDQGRRLALQGIRIGELLETLQAIKARVNGEFDNPALVKIGPLRSTHEDIAFIIDKALEKAEKIKEG